MGLVECVKSDLIHPYPILSEKKGEIVAQFKYTVAVRNDGPFIIAGLPLDVTKYSSDYKITNEDLLKSFEVNYIFLY